LPSSLTTAKPCFAESPPRLVALALSVALACASAACSRKTQAGSHGGRGTATARATSTALVSPSASAPEAAEPANAAPAASAANGTRAPLETVSAEQLIARVRVLGGKGTLVNAWASWCGPCRREVPMLQKLAPKFAAQGVSILLVSLDEPEDQAKALAFLEEEAITLPSLLAARPLGPFKRGMSPRWPGMLPASFLFDAEGTRRYFFGGEAFEEEMVPVIDSFVKGTLEETESKYLTAPGR
jgi:cytochrome c biogenesis protein CcmG, thiol:disulfide interchange protein DsbE